MTTEINNIVNLELTREDKLLNFKDFQKQSLKFDIEKLQEAYKQIIKTKKFDDGGGISHFGAICLTRKPGDPDSIKGHKARGLYWTKPDKSGKEVSRDVNINEAEYSEFIPDYENTYFKEVFDVISSKYKLGRVRILLKEPRSTLSWHRSRTKIAYSYNYKSRLLNGN